MNLSLLGYTLLYVFSALACLASIPRARTIQHKDTRRGLIALLISVAVWSLGYTGYLLAPTTTTKLTSYILGFVFAFVAVAAWIYFCAAYTGRPLHNIPYKKLGIITFIALTALKITNPIHNFYFTTTPATTPFPHLAIQHQPLYWAILGLSYVIIGIGFFMLLEQLYYTGTDSRPLVFLLSLTGIPAILTIFSNELPGVLPLMYEPPGVALFAVGTLFIYLNQFEAIRRTSEHSSPAIFLDPNDNIRDYNQAASSLFPALNKSTDTHLTDINTELATHTTDNNNILTITNNNTTHYYETSTAPFLSGNVQTGQLLTLTDVTEREQYRQQLENKTEQLEVLNNMIRHDIRNDMSVIVGWGDELEKHITPDGEDALERILQKSNHVIELTELAREFVETLTADQTTSLEATNLHDILETELESVRDSHANATFDVTQDIPQTTVTANEMLSAVFRNLFENAVRHNDTNTPETTISFEETEDIIRVHIADNGPGVPDDQKETVFGKGEKGLDSPGTGIGLYLVHTLTTQFGGDVWIEDNTPRGAVFIVELQKH